MLILLIYLFNQVWVIDSSTVYTLWGQTQECIAYNTIVDGVQIVTRAYSSTGNLNVHQTDGAVSFWVHDYPVYTGQIGSTRYPHSIASDNSNGPHICFPCIVSGYWDGRGAQFECGGWWSSYWDSPVNISPNSVGVCKVLGKQLSNGNILFVCQGINGEIWCSEYPPDLSAPLMDGIIGYGYLWGFDINDAIGYIFWRDTTYNYLLFCSIDTSGISSCDTYDIILPNPYPQSLICYTQMAVTDAGNPLLVFDIRNGEDITYPYYSKVYVSYAEGESCVEVSSTFGVPDTECFYPTIATEGNLAAVIYSMPRNNLNDSLCWNDIFINWSTDQGVTWGIPKNLTRENDSIRLGLQQIAKRIDIQRERAFIVYAGCTYDPYWCAGYGTGCNCSIYFIFNNYTGIQEETDLPFSPYTLGSLEVYPNPFRNHLVIKFQTPSTKSQNPNNNGSLAIYDVTGRLVRQWDYKTIRLSDQIIWDGTDESGHRVPPGIYFVRLETEDFKQIAKVIFLK